MVKEKTVEKKVEVKKETKVVEAKKDMVSKFGVKLNKKYIGGKDK